MTMNITFMPLTASHFPLLLKWLESPHVKKWLDPDVKYTLDAIQKKYGDYVNGYKLISETQSIPIQAYIICLNEQAIGYIQLYKAYDFPKNNLLMDLPENLAAIDVFIGEESYLSKNIGLTAIKTFLDQYVFLNYRYVLVDPEYTNERAVKAFEKAGFIILKRINKTFWMMAHKNKE